MRGGSGAEVEGRLPVGDPPSATLMQQRTEYCKPNYSLQVRLNMAAGY